MAKRMKIKWNMAGFRALRTDPAVVADIRDRAAQIAAAAGDGYEVGDPQTPRNRAHTTVFTATDEAREKESATHDLLLALGEAAGQKIYTTKSGKKRLATEKQIANWTRNRG